MSVKAWYEMHPEHDDRPEAIKKRLGMIKIEEEKEQKEDIQG